MSYITQIKFLILVIKLYRLYTVDMLIMIDGQTLLYYNQNIHCDIKGTFLKLLQMNLSDFHCMYI